MPEAERGATAGRPSTASRSRFCESSFGSIPHSSRWKLSRQLCEALGWKQANGALRDVVCRGLLLMLERAGEIELPPVRWRIRWPAPDGAPRPEAVLIDTTPLTMPLGSVGPDRDSTRAAHGRRAAVQ